MGPGGEEGQLRGTDPPLFSPERYSYGWRKSLAQWVSLTRNSADKSDEKRYKTRNATLAHVLYTHGLPKAQRSIVDQAIEKGLVDLETDDQVSEVKKIVDLVAIDPPISIMTRLIDSFNKVTGCRKKNGEDLSSFVFRFLGLAAEHLIHAGVSSSSQIGEVLAITLLNNAALNETTLTNAKQQLIALADSSAFMKPAEPKRHFISEEDSRIIEQAIKNIETSRDLIKSETNKIQDSSSPQLVAVKKQLKEASRAISSSMFEVKQVLTAVTEDKESDPVKTLLAEISFTGRQCPLMLDDAVNVLRSLPHTSSDREQTISMANVESMVTERVQKGLLALNKPSTSVANTYFLSK